jgi:G:T-mismatch repair DNA endonuclease (very short patch repair protein)
MYGHATAQPQCTGLGRRWKPTAAGNPAELMPHEFYDYARSELEWLSWRAHESGVHIKHRWNTGRVQNVHGKFPDGYAPKTKTCYFFDGCYWHGHRCALTRCHEPLDSEFWKRGGRDFQIRKFLQARGYKVEVMRECEWVNAKGFNPRIESFLDEHFTLPMHHTPMDVDQLLRLVRQEKFFGLVRCAIRVPPEDRAKWEDMPPLFYNAMVSRADIGQHMRSFCETHDLLKTPRRTLVSGFASLDIMLGTPLLKWYLEHGLEVLEVIEAFEFKPKACFSTFIAAKTQERRLADSDPVKYGIKGDAAKLAINW